MQYRIEIPYSRVAMGPMLAEVSAEQLISRQR